MIIPAHRRWLRGLSIGPEVTGPSRRMAGGRWTYSMTGAGDDRMAEERQVRSAQPVAPVASPFFTAGGFFLALAALYFGRDIFLPFALAILLAFALAPLVDWLRRFKIPASQLC